jgi:UrcA family protein
MFVIPCIALSVFLSPLGVAATALSPGYETVTHTVNFADLDLTNGRAVATLYARIKSAADKVCEPVAAQPYEPSVSVRRCKEQAITQAVEDVNSSGLTSLHVAATNQADFRR